MSWRFEKGNKVLDELAQHFANQARSVFDHPVACESSGQEFYIVFVGYEGDLPAQARTYHLKRNFGCSQTQCAHLGISDRRKTRLNSHSIGLRCSVEGVSVEGVENKIFFLKRSAIKFLQL